MFRIQESKLVLHTTLTDDFRNVGNCTAQNTVTSTSKTRIVIGCVHGRGSHHIQYIGVTIYINNESDNNKNYNDNEN